MVAVPVLAPSVTTPVDELMLASAELLLLHEPPPGELASVAFVDDGQPDKVPVIDPGTGLTVTTVRALSPGQGACTESIIVTVPCATPETTPVDALTVATEVLVLYHVPDMPELDSVVVLPTQTVAVPVMLPIALHITVMFT